MAVVIVLEDDADLRRMMVAWLKAAGHEVSDSADGYLGRRLAEMQNPNLVVVDIGIPGQDGLQVIYTLRQQQKDLKVMAISGGPDLPVAKELGADAILMKPFRKQQFVDAVERLLSA
jgi:DNA-binding response OmpR family regulator